MSFTTFTNVITILFCLAVLVQSVRMMRSLKQMREGKLGETILAVDNATAQARSVLCGLRETLSVDGAANSRTLVEAREIREELNIMIGIANAMAERLIDAASVTSQQDHAKTAAQPVKPGKTTQAARSTGSPKTSTRAPNRKSVQPTAPKNVGSRKGRTVAADMVKEGLSNSTDQEREVA